MNTNIKVIGLTGLGIKPKSTAAKADDLTSSELFVLSCVTLSFLNVFYSVGRTGRSTED